MKYMRSVKLAHVKLLYISFQHFLLLDYCGYWDCIVDLGELQKQLRRLIRGDRAKGY